MTHRIAGLCALVIAGLTAAGASAQTGDWRQIARDAEVQVAIDMGSVTGPSSARVMQTAMASTEAGDPVAYMLVEITIDCEARIFQATHLKIYGHDGAVVMEQRPERDPTAARANDGTLIMVNAACDGTMPEGPAFASAKAFSDWVISQRPGGA